MASLQGHLSGFTTFRDGNPTFRKFVVNEVRLFATTTVPTAGSFSVTALSPIELLLTDAEGRRLGHRDGTDFFEIPNGTYFRDFPAADDSGTGTAEGDPSGRKTVHITFPSNSQYQLEVSGTSLGPYTLVLRAVHNDGSVQEVVSTGITDIGAAASYSANYSPTPGTDLQVTHPITFADMLRDISGSQRLGLINRSLARVLSRDVMQASEANDRGDLPEARRILVMFKAKFARLGPTRIAQTASQVLLDDAESLLRQLHGGT